MANNKGNGKENENKVVRIKESDLIRVLDEAAKKLNGSQEENAESKQSVKENSKPKKSRKLQKLDEYIDKRAEQKAAEKIQEVFSKFSENGNKK